MPTSTLLKKRPDASEAISSANDGEGIRNSFMNIA